MRLASATESAKAATYAGEFRGTLANFRAAKIAEQIAMTADFRGRPQTRRHHIRFIFASGQNRTLYLAFHLLALKLSTRAKDPMYDFGNQHGP
jgi:hypothetical protein